MRLEDLMVGTDLVLNPYLVLSQGLTAEDVERLKGLHVEMLSIKALFHCAAPGDFDALLAQVEALEFRLQAAWRLGRDRTRHVHWRMVPGCRCPVRVNVASLGRPVQVVGQDCPVHARYAVEGLTIVPEGDVVAREAAVHPVGPSLH